MARSKARKSFGLLLLMLVSTGVAAHPVNEYMTGDAASERDGLCLTAQLSKAVYPLDELVHIDVVLTNVSERDILIYRGVNSGSFVWLQDSKGDSLFNRIVSCFLIPPPYPEEDFITIAPGEEIHGHRVISAATYGITRPGSFAVTVGYESPIPARYGPKWARFWSREDGALRVESLMFEFVSY